MCLIQPLDVTSSTAESLASVLTAPTEVPVVASGLHMHVRHLKPQASLGPQFALFWSFLANFLSASDAQVGIQVRHFCSGILHLRKSIYLTLLHLQDSDGRG